MYSSSGSSMISQGKGEGQTCRWSRPGEGAPLLPNWGGGWGSAVSPPIGAWGGANTFWVGNPPTNHVLNVCSTELTIHSYRKHDTET